jgi:bifunctional non-homologous end joining protein LigD
MTHAGPENAKSAAEALDEYRRRRDFARTAEPSGAATPAGEVPATHPVFVVQKHAATSLHYDFRLELGGVLKSWAVPKGPSLDPADKRLAMRVEDHPLEYAVFEGTIPQGEYGGGTVLLWDFGWWEPDVTWMKSAKGGGPTDPHEALAAGDLKFVLHGHKLSGSWALVQMKGQGGKNWLLLKHRDPAARPGVSVVKDAPDSVLSERSLEQIAAAGAE